MRRILVYYRWPRGKQPVALGDFLGRVDDVNCGGLTQSQHARRAEKDGLESQRLVTVRIQQRDARAEYLPVCVLAFSNSAYVRYSPGAQIDSAFLGADDARRLLQTPFLNHQRPGQERLDDPGRNGWDRPLPRRVR